MWKGITLVKDKNEIFRFVYFSSKMCNQVRIMKSAAEDFNADCKLMNPSGGTTDKLNPVASGEIWWY